MQKTSDNGNAGAFRLLVLTICTATIISCEVDDRAGDDFYYDYHVEELYDPGRVVEVDLTINSSDWDQLRKEEHDIVNEIGYDCTGVPGSPYNYYPARVTIDGAESRLIGVRKKGFQGSMSDTRPSLKLKFGQFEENQKIMGLKRLTLNNNRQDASKMKQCIGYAIFARAGAPAGQCNFARVTVNGEYLGIYSNVEPIKKPLLKRVFGDDGGNLYEATSADFRRGEAWTSRFEKKTNETEPDRSDIERVIEAFELDGQQLIDRLPEVLNTDQFITFWALEAIIAHWDGYSGNTNNYYFYFDPADGLLNFIPWGIDGIFAWPNMILPGAPTDILARGVIAYRLYRLPEYREKYAEKMRQIISEVWDSKALIKETERIAKLIGPSIPPEELERFNNELHYLQSFLYYRDEELISELADGPSPWEYPPLSIPCPRPH